MKKILIVLFTLVAFIAKGQNFHFDTIYAKKAYTDTTRTSNLGVTIVGQDTLYFFGNSITFGYNLTDQLTRFSSVLSRMLNMYEVNNGLNSSTLMKRSPQDPWGAANMIDRLSLIPTKIGRRKYIVFVYGVNDLRWNTVNYDTVNFKADYRTVIDTCIARGWSAQDIIVVSPFYVKDPEAYTADVVTTGNPLVTAARHAMFADAVKKISIEKGTQYVEGYQDTRDNMGKPGLSDNVHLNPGGNQFVAGDIYQKIFATSAHVTKDTQNVAIDGLVEFRILKLRNPDTVLSRFNIVVWRQSDRKVGITDLVHAFPPASINNIGSLSLDSQATRGYKRFQDNIAVGTLPGSVAGMDVYKSGSELPAYDLEDGDVTTPSYSSVGHIPALTTHTIGRIGAATVNGGVNITGWTNSLEDRPVFITGVSGKTSITNSVLNFQAYKTDGSNNRIAIAGTESALDLQNAGTSLIKILGNGNIGQGITPVATAKWLFPAGTTGIAPIRFTSGSLLTTPVAGTEEFLTDKRYTTISTGTARKEYALFDIAGTSGRVPFETTNGRLTDNSNFTYDGTTLVVPTITVTTPGLIKYSHTIFTPTTGGTVSLVNNQYNIINPAGALVALTVNLPSTPANNDAVYIKYTQTVSTVTYGNGTVIDGITSPVAGGLVILVYDSGTTSWY